ncbi:hypothetical protein V5O48_002128 [Marasmius crinis-equi]|uniref:C2H2-type domain-containing protein n=1 Tax=Marasmius crinis-equi TaxID=585013 RepID=A0ABR3FWK4_9AGAR
MSVWKAARSNVEGLPDIPDDMSEPAYAHLCFDTQCHHCDSKAFHLLWHDRTKCCKTCIENEINYTLEHVVLDPLGVYEDMRLFHNWTSSRFWNIVLYRGDVVGPDEIRLASEFVCSRSSRSLLYRQYRENEHDATWIESKIAEGKARHEHAKEMENWWQRKMKDHESELASRRKAREDAILQRLTGLGWKEEINKQREQNGLSIFDKFRLGTQAKKLTEKDWNDLRPRLEEALQGAKERRLESELKAKWKDRYVTFKTLLQAELDKSPVNTLRPSVFDIAVLPQFQEKLFLPIEHELTPDDMSDLFAQIPQIIDQWVQAREADFVNLLKQEGVADATPDTLRCAATIFICAVCSPVTPCVYPQPLMHRCSRRCGYLYDGGTFTEPSFPQFLRNTNGKVWDIKDYRFAPTLSTTARKILSTVGLSANATVAEVRETNLWLEYQERWTQERVLIPIMQAMYARSGYRPELGFGWTIVSTEDIALATQQARNPDRYDPIVCRRCQTLLEVHALEQHLKDAHEITESPTPQDVIFPADAPLTALQRRHVYRRNLPLPTTNPSLASSS